MVDAGFKKIVPFQAVSQPFVVTETDDFIILYKPAFFHSVSLRSKNEPSLATWYREQCPEWATAFQQASLDYSEKKSISDALKARLFSEFGMLSRLDYQTSGLVAFAKKPVGIVRILNLTSQNTSERGVASSFSDVSKAYLLACSPSGTGLQGSKPLRVHTISDNHPLEVQIASYFRSWGEKGHKVACIAPEFHAGVHRSKKLSTELYTTSIKVLKTNWTDANCSDRPEGVLLMKAGITRGFRHQIRAHCAWLGYPILGDTEYGGIPARRLFLESFSLTLPDKAGKTQRIELYPEHELL
mgnify:CR=1 FL=1